MIPIIGPEEIRPHLRILDLIPTTEIAYRAISDGTAQAPAFVLHPNSQADIHIKSASLADCPIFTVKMAGWSQVLVDRGEPASSGMIAVFDSETCKPLAVLQDEHLISDYRTAAAGALVARMLAPEAARSALIVGTGIQARLQVEALLLVRNIKAIEIWGRNRTKAESLAEELCLRFPTCRFTAVSELAGAVNKADVIVTVTGAKEPVILGEWLRSGQHITSVGSDDMTKCEIGANALAISRLFVDSIPTALRYGSIGNAISNGLLQSDRLVEIGKQLDAPPYRNTLDITIACLTGLGVQDLTAVNSIWRAIAQRIEHDDASSTLK
jgi:ornithine cyclodeaminase/alanine dehydrogenase-like protein (mu-crystallin family)